MDKARRWLVAFAFALVISGGWLLADAARPHVIITHLGASRDITAVRADGRLLLYSPTILARWVRVDGQRFATGGTVSDAAFSPGGRHFGWIEEADRERHLIVDGRRVGGGWVQRFWLAEDGQATWLERTAPWQYHLVVGGQRLGPFDGVVTADADAERYPRDRSQREQSPGPAPVGPCLVGLVGQRRHLIVGRQQFGPFDRIDEMLLSPDKQHWACVVRRDGREALLWDGRLMGWHDHVYAARPAEYGPGDRYRFSADSRHVTWQSRDGHREQVWVDDRPYPLGGEPGRRWPTVTGDGAHLLWPARGSDDPHWLVDGQPIAGGAAVDGQPTTGGGSAWAVVSGELGRMVVHSHLGRFGPFRRVVGPAVSEPGGELAWVAADSSGWRLWIDGQRRGWLHAPDDLRYGPRGHLLCALVRRPDGRSTFWVNGENQPWLDATDVSPDVSHDGRRLAFRGRLGGPAVVVLGGRVVVSADSIRHVTWAPDDRGLLVTCDTGRLDLPGLANRRVEQSIGLPTYCFGADGRHWLYIDGRAGSTTVDHDGRRSAPLRAAEHASLSPNGRHAVARVQPAPARLPAADEPWWTLLDGRLIEADFGDGEFGPDGAYRTLVRDGDRARLVTIRWHW